jgi:hypothetical protein
VLLEALEHRPQVGEMLLRVCTRDQDVIDVDKHPRKILKDTIHEPLKGLPSVAESKGHPQELPQTKGSGDGCLLDVIRRHWNLVVSSD